MREVNGTFFYLENSSGIPELVNPPCAWYVYHLITVARPYLLMSAVILLIIEYIRKREKVHAWIKKFRET
jgi:hypothetical protein